MGNNINNINHNESKNKGISNDNMTNRSSPMIPSKNSLPKVDPKNLHNYIKFTDNYLVWNLSGLLYFNLIFNQYIHYHYFLKNRIQI